MIILVKLLLHLKNNSMNEQLYHNILNIASTGGYPRLYSENLVGSKGVQETNWVHPFHRCKSIMVVENTHLHPIVLFLLVKS